MCAPSLRATARTNFSAATASSGVTRGRGSSRSGRRCAASGRFRRWRSRGCWAARRSRPSCRNALSTGPCGSPRRRASAAATSASSATSPSDLAFSLGRFAYVTRFLKPRAPGGGRSRSRWAAAATAWNGRTSGTTRNGAPKGTSSQTALSPELGSPFRAPHRPAVNPFPSLAKNAATSSRAKTPRTAERAAPGQPSETTHTPNCNNKKRTQHRSLLHSLSLGTVMIGVACCAR
mmetsp:Transcript_41190/g.87625  ORF Transcript_41190/g.87625 Transcript_41190/m.87625 type:complete len:234 (+) Transcript_41190:479-1180(+)